MTAAFDAKDMADARATAVVLRATACALRGQRGTPSSRMLQAAATLDRMVILALKLRERIEQLEQELHLFRVRAP
jgi:hypothetical protein